MYNGMSLFSDAGVFFFLCVFYSPTASKRETRNEKRCHPNPPTFPYVEVCFPFTGVRMPFCWPPNTLQNALCTSKLSSFISLYRIRKCYTLFGILRWVGLALLGYAVLGYAVLCSALGRAEPKNYIVVIEFLLFLLVPKFYITG